MQGKRMLTMVAYHNAVEQSSNAKEYSIQMFDGYSMMRTLAPKACGGKLDLNFDLTAPLLPCGRVTRPQITRTFDPAISRLARYTYATRFPR